MVWLGCQSKLPDDPELATCVGRAESRAYMKDLREAVYAAWKLPKGIKSG
jgi:hypothetical protein